MVFNMLNTRNFQFALFLMHMKRRDTSELFVTDPVDVVWETFPHKALSADVCVTTLTVILRPELYHSLGVMIKTIRLSLSCGSEGHLHFSAFDWRNHSNTFLLLSGPGRPLNPLHGDLLQDVLRPLLGHTEAAQFHWTCHVTLRAPPTGGQMTGPLPGITFLLGSPNSRQLIWTRQVLVSSKPSHKLIRTLHSLTFQFLSSAVKIGYKSIFLSRVSEWTGLENKYFQDLKIRSLLT